MQAGEAETLVIQESAGAREEGVVVSGRSQPQKAEARRIQHTGVKQARRSPSPASIFQGFGTAEQAGPIKDVLHANGQSSANK